MKRKEFLKISSGASLAMLAVPSGLSAMWQEDEAKKMKTFGIQLYTVRDDLPKDPKGVIKKLSSFGYKQIESYEGSKGMFWGMTNKEFKTYLDGLGMTIVSSHCGIEKDFEKKAGEAAEIGMKYLICPWIGSQKTPDGYKKMADNFNQKGEICKKNGIRFAYHNHAYSFENMNGETGQDIMMKNTDAGLVDFELDMYWVVTGGQDIEAWLKKYPNRFRLCHVKDRKKNAMATDTDASCTLGTGSIDYKKILKSSRQYGMEYFIVEQERYDGTTAIKATEESAKYMKTIKV